MLCRPQDSKSSALRSGHSSSTRRMSIPEHLPRKLHFCCDESSCAVTSGLTTSCIWLLLRRWKEMWLASLPVSSGRKRLKSITFMGPDTASHLVIRRPRRCARAPKMLRSSVWMRTWTENDALVEIGAEDARSTVRPLVSALGTTRLWCRRQPGLAYSGRTLRRAPLIHRLEDLFWRRRADVILPLTDISKELWGADNSEGMQVSTLRAFRSSCARARNVAGELPLIPHKLHLQVRTASTVSACVNPNCTAPEELKWPSGGGLVAAALDRCNWCGKALLTMARCGNCGRWLFTGVYREGDSSLHPRHRWTGELVTFCSTGGRGRRLLVRLQYPAAFGYPMESSVSLKWAAECPNCSETAEDFDFVGISDQSALPLTAETMLAEMPPLSTQANEWLPARGRRILVFSAVKEKLLG